MSAPKGLKANAIGCGNLTTYQLLCGRDIANPKTASPQEAEVFSVAQGMANYVYLVVNTKENTALAVDAAWDVAGLYKLAEAMGVSILGCVYTHSHFDHCGGQVNPMFTGGRDVMLPGAQDVVARGGRIWVGKEDAALVEKQCRIPSSSITTLDDGAVVTAGDIMLHTLHTPGHTAGSLCVLVNPATVSPRPAGSSGAVTVDAKAGVLITGDTLFPGSCGRTDLPGSDQSKMFRSLSRLSGMAPDVYILPGHNYSPQPYTTILDEKRCNQIMGMGMKTHPNPPPLPPCCSHGHAKWGPLGLTSGRRVRIEVADTPAEKDLLGQVGLVRGYHQDTDCYEVQLPRDGPPLVKHVKATNLAPQPSAAL